MLKIFKIVIKKIFGSNFTWVSYSKDKIYFFPFDIGILNNLDTYYRCSPPEVFLGKDVLKICSKFTSEHPCRSLISIKMLRNFALQLYWNHTLTWVFSCKLAAYFLNTFSEEHPWVAASDNNIRVSNMKITEHFLQNT